MNHNFFLEKRRPADWTKANASATHYMRLKNGQDFFTVGEVNSPFAKGVILSGDYRVVYREERPTTQTTVHVMNHGEHQKYVFPGEVDQETAIRYLKEDKMYENGMSVMCTYEKVKNVNVVES